MLGGGGVRRNGPALRPGDTAEPNRRNLTGRAERLPRVPPVHSVQPGWGIWVPKVCVPKMARPDWGFRAQGISPPPMVLVILILPSPRGSGILVLLPGWYPNYAGAGNDGKGNHSKHAEVGWKRRAGGGGWHKASVSDCLPLAAPIGLSPLLILTLCGPESALVVSTEPLDDLSCLTTPGSELGLGTCNPCFVAWPLELGLGTLNPRNLVHIVHVRGFCFFKRHMGWGVYRNKPAVQPADSAGRTIARRCQPDFRPKSSVAVLAGRTGRPTLSLAPSLSAEPHRRSIPMNSPAPSPPF